MTFSFGKLILRELRYDIIAISTYFAVRTTRAFVCRKMRSSWSMHSLSQRKCCLRPEWFTPAVGGERGFFRLHSGSRNRMFTPQLKLPARSSNAFRATLRALSASVGSSIICCVSSCTRCFAAFLSWPVARQDTDISLATESSLRMSASRCFVLWSGTGTAIGALRRNRKPAVKKRCISCWRASGS